MSKKPKTILQLNSFKSWQFGGYCITQYRPFLFIISKSGKDLWKVTSLRRAVKWATEHAK